MFGALLRGTLGAAFIVLIGAIAGRILPPLLDVMLVSGRKDDLLISTLTIVEDNLVFVGLIAVLVAILARAVIESQAGGI